MSPYQGKGWEPSFPLGEGLGWGQWTFTGVRWRPFMQKNGFLLVYQRQTWAAPWVARSWWLKHVVEWTKEKQQEPVCSPQRLLSLQPRPKAAHFLFRNGLGSLWLLEVRLPSRIRSSNEKCKYHKNETQCTSVEISVASQVSLLTWISNESHGSQRSMPENHFKYWWSSREEEATAHSVSQENKIE